MKKLMICIYVSMLLTIPVFCNENDNKDEIWQQAFTYVQGCKSYDMLSYKEITDVKYLNDTLKITKITDLYCGQKTLVSNYRITQDTLYIKTEDTATIVPMCQCVNKYYVSLYVPNLPENVVINEESDKKIVFKKQEILEKQRYKKMLHADAIWDVEYWSKSETICRTNAYTRFYLGTKEVINDKEYFTIKCKSYKYKYYPCNFLAGYVLDTIEGDYGLTREDTIERKVYILCDEEEYLLYDFSKSIGDTISLISYNDYCLFDFYTYKLYNIEDYKLVDNQIVNSFNFNGVPIYESVGSHFGPFHSLNNFESGTYLECMKVGNVIKYGSELPNAIYEYVSKGEFKFFPNPASDLLNMVAPEHAEIAVLDIAGKSMLSFKVEKGDNQLNISNLPAGYYTIQTVTEKDISIYSFIKL